MSNRKLDIIRPSLELVRLSDGDLLLRANAVHDGMIRNAAYPSPWVSMDAFKAAIRCLYSRSGCDARWRQASHGCA